MEGPALALALPDCKVRTLWMTLSFPGARDLLHHLLETGQGVVTFEGCDFSSRAHSITVIIPQLSEC